MKKIMKKNILILIALLFWIINFNFVKAEQLDIYSNYAILYNLDDDIVLYEKNADTETSIASLTKIMTCIVAIENIDNLDSKVKLDYNVFYGLAEANASVAGFRVGDVVTYRDLVMGALLPSGADATRALAINIAGNETSFVELMNKKVEELNLKHTHFANTTGLEAAGHYSTVRDISFILKYALKNETFKSMYTTREYKATNGLKFSSTLKKVSNNYTIDVTGILGTKTGYTDEAGLCMSSIANYNDVNYLLITAGADYRGNTPRQLLDAKNIYNYYSSHYGYKSIITKDEKIDTIRVKYSKEKEFDILSPKTISKFLNNDFDLDKITYQYIGENVLSYKNKINEKIGVINIIYDNDIIDSVDVILTNSFKFSIFAFLIQTKIIYLILTFIVIVLLLLIRKRNIRKKRRRHLKQ